MRYAVVIPVYNELHTFEALLDRVLAAQPALLPGGALAERIIIAIDDGSTDGTAELIDARADGERIIAMRHDRNQGKGAALRTGFRRAVEIGVDAAIVQDADLEYDPGEHPLILAPIFERGADAVFGTRFLGQTHRVLYYWHAVGNRVITTLSNMFTNLNLTDVECCFKAFTTDVLARMDTRENRFGIEPELVARCASMRIEDGDGGARPLRLYEAPVSYDGRTYAEGKKIGWRDGVRAIYCILRYNFFR